ncbi:MAG: arylsulfatase [Candidatus Nealsonbacteria bacterium]|nr:arylsulfatase [Candidatus Nealsonbacteria bacterium]
MRHLALVAAGILLMLNISPLRAEDRSAEDRSSPNILLIVADDLGYGNLGCYGQRHIRTPVLDQMAKEGLRFTHFYAGASLCLPSRCTLMTGLHTGHSRCRVNGGGGKHPPIHEEDTTLATVLKAAGYRTGMVGKWALGDHFRGCVVEHQNTDGPGALYKHGWDYYFGEPNQTYNHRYYPPQLYRYDPHGWIATATEGRRLDVVPLKNEKNGRSGDQYSHDLLVENALAFIKASRDDPFFLYVPFTIPHADFVVPEPEPYVQDQSWPKQAKVFASMISRMDRDVGRILKLLDTLGIEKNTLVIFTSDNGGLSAHDGTFHNNGPLDGYKGSLTEGGLRVPCIAHWPGRIRPGRESEEKLAFWDFMPTFSELAGIEPPTPIDGISFVPTLLESGEQMHHRYLFFGTGKGKRFYVVRGQDENRSDEEISAEANTEVIVPTYRPES